MSSIMKGTLTVIPAYNRDYGSKQEVEKAWNEGRDFQIVTLGHGGKYINKQDAQRNGVGKIKVRYNKKKYVHFVNK